MTFRDELSENSGRGHVDANIHLIRGREPILGMQSVLTEFSEQCGQPGATDDIGYFLSKPGLLRRVPELLLFTKSPVPDLSKLSAEDIAGSLLLYRYQAFGCDLRMFTTNDRSGRGTVVAALGMRAKLVSIASRWLVDRGALAVMTSFRDADSVTPREEQLAGDCAGGSRLRWAWRERDVMEYLPMEATYDATLAGIGQRTRRNMRYYRRQAEAQLGCTFVPEAKIDEDEFLAFSDSCMYAVPARTAAWRYRSLRDLSQPLLMGTKDKEGRWLSLLGGRRRRDGTEILWQMNRDGLAHFSLGVVMRSYFIEHEVGAGMKRLYMDGGTGHPIRFSFVKERVNDLAVLRSSLLGSLIPRVAKHFVKYDNELAVMLVDPELRWNSSEEDLLARLGAGAASET